MKALKRMKNNKSPGSDGYTVEFFKFFSKDLLDFVLRSIKYGFNNHELSSTQRQGIITCLPKGEKSKLYLKNWRPITLLNVVYKLASSCIAERIKKVLDFLISNDQTGFIKGRFIGENTRLVSRTSGFHICPYFLIFSIYFPWNFHGKKYGGKFHNADIRRICGLHMDYIGKLGASLYLIRRIYGKLNLYTECQGLRLFFIWKICVALDLDFS